MKINNIIKNNWLLIVIVLLASIIRLFKLSTVPPHLTPDEASLGYNAYSILKTGKDEYGKALPLIFKSFGDYKPGLYVYSAIPFIATLGLNELAVRLPSAIAGVLAVILIYKIVELLFENRKTALLSSLLLAINPWHIQYSRGAWEINLSLTLLLFGIYFLIRAFQKPKLIVTSSVFFALTFLTYQGAKLSTLIAFVALIIAYKNEVLGFIKQNLRSTLFAAMIGFLIILPVIFSFFQGQTGRLAVFSIFSYQRPVEYVQSILNQGNESLGSLSHSLFHSEGLSTTRGIMTRWFNHYSAKFLFFVGDWQNPRHSSPNSGMFLVADLIFILAGLIYLSKNKNQGTIFILIWILLSPLPAALSRDQVHAVRAYNLVIPLTITSALGVYYVAWLVEKVRLKKLLYILVIAFYSFSLIYFIDSFFTHLSFQRAKHWHYGLKQAVETINPIQGNYEKIVFQQSYSQPYIYFLFYQKYDPTTYQKNAKLSGSGLDVGLVTNLDNISFESFSWPHKTGETGTLIVGDNIVIPDNFSQKDYKLISEIKYPNNFNTAIRIVEAK